MNQQCQNCSIYNQIAQKLIADIQAGIYGPGDRLPSENQLATQYKVHRLTARQAITALVEMDLVCRQQGRGTFVKKKKIDYSLNSKTSFTESLFNLGYLPCIRILSSKIITASPQFSNLLETNVGASILKIKFLRAATPAMTGTTIPDMEPLCISTSYLISERFPDLEVLIYRATSLYSLLQNYYGIQPRRAHIQIETELASKEEAKLLKIAPSVPLLVTKSQVRDQHDYLFEYTISRFRGERFSLEVSC
ncbi:GntR family transcriptional regulator [Nostoc sp. CHAB 5784]|uniref:GntR family transcriptional regulator n=1 Tax=Nostoc mirabile TaxID=2907820 RepID=UPI001E4D4CE1|nr:GntR family transcriptional regulator [Nostoc mirabile]MCC5668869.1 GntR family transcriptional regulator [Nostoc mirabile CHAB5784]